MACGNTAILQRDIDAYKDTLGRLRSAGEDEGARRALAALVEEAQMAVDCSVGGRVETSYMVPYLASRAEVRNLRPDLVPLLRPVAIREE